MTVQRRGRARRLLAGSENPANLAASRRRITWVSLLSPQATHRQCGPGKPVPHLSGGLDTEHLWLMVLAQPLPLLSLKARTRAQGLQDNVD